MLQKAFPIEHCMPVCRLSAVDSGYTAQPQSQSGGGARCPTFPLNKGRADRVRNIDSTVRTQYDNFQDCTAEDQCIGKVRNPGNSVHLNRGVLRLAMHSLRCLQRQPVDLRCNLPPTQLNVDVFGLLNHFRDKNSLPKTSSMGSPVSPSPGVTASL